VIGKAEWTKGEADPRFIVTSLNRALHIATGFSKINISFDIYTVTEAWARPNTWIASVSAAVANR